jgi:2-polyprenyl-6-methoxyphenol hydroxylase-like FAD-dependent oxidoreductase
MIMKVSHNVLIVGGGIAGLTLAVGLRRSGVAVRIIEIQPQWDVLGVGISLTAPTLRALKSIDLTNRCVCAGFGFDRITFADAAGTQIDAISFPHLSGPEYPAMVAITRRALHDILLEAAKEQGAEVSLGTTLTALTQRQDSVDVVLSNGERHAYDLVVGCDGIHSVVRDLVFPDVPDAGFTGLAVWRATIPRPAEVTCMQLFYGPSTKAGVNPHSKDEMFLFLVQPILDPTPIAADRKHLILQQLLAEYDSKVIRHVRDYVTDPAAVDYRPMDAFLLPPPWHRGRAMVIGDAAHTTTPHLATGAGIAIEDAIVLAEVLGSDLPISEALDCFMTRRFERCRMVVETALKLGEMERDSSIPIKAHLSLMGVTFRQLAAPI